MKWLKRIHRFFFPPECNCKIGNRRRPWPQVMPVRDCPVHGDEALSK